MGLEHGSERTQPSVQRNQPLSSIEKSIQSTAVSHWRAPLVAVVLLALGCGVVRFESRDAAADANTVDAGADVDRRDVPDDAESDAGVLDSDIDVDAAVDAGPAGTGTALDLGSRHSCVIRSGRLFCFGQNNLSQLGLGDTTDRFEATRVGDESDWVQVSASGGHMCGIRAGGFVSCWGANEFGQLGVGDQTSRTVPSMVELPGPATDVSVGESHSCALLADSRLACWGRGLEGAHGLGDGFDGPDILVPMIVPGSESWVDVSAGGGHTLAVGGSLFGVGRNTADQLGLGPGASEQYRNYTEVLATAPTAIGAGQDNSCVVLPPGELFCWGQNGRGEIGLGDTLPRDSPHRVGTESDWELIALNFWATCGVRRDGVYCAGRGVEGQLGSGSWDDSLVFLRTLEGDVLELAMGRNHACVLLRSGEVMCTGDNGDGQLGTPGPARRNTWEVVVFPED